MSIEIDAHVTEATAEIDRVAALIKARVPDAGPGLAGGALDAYGSSRWTPARSPSLNYSAWGPWEAWAHCEVDNESVVPAVHPVGRAAWPTGDWVAWDSSTGQTLGFPAGQNALRKAEMMAVLQNEGKPTRIVFADGSFRESRLDYEVLRAQVAGESARILATPQA